MCEAILSIILTGSPTPSHPRSPTGHPGLWGSGSTTPGFMTTPFLHLQLPPCPQRVHGLEASTDGGTAPGCVTRVLLHSSGGHDHSPTYLKGFYLD